MAEETTQERFERFKREAKAKRAAKAAAVAAAKAKAAAAKAAAAAAKKKEDEEPGDLQKKAEEKSLDSDGEMTITGERGGTIGPGLGSNEAPRQSRINNSRVQRRRK
jgi:membrane protein involved in colicin uptake